MSSFFLTLTRGGNVRRNFVPSLPSVAEVFFSRAAECFGVGSKPTDLRAKLRREKSLAGKPLKLPDKPENRSISA